MSDYRWDSPQEWLEEHCRDADDAELRSVINELLSKLSADDIQDLFQTEMTQDGYFIKYTR